MKKRLVDLTKANKKNTPIQLVKNKKTQPPRNVKPLIPGITNEQTLTDIHAPENYQSHSKVKLELPKKIEHLIKFSLVAFFLILVITSIHALSEAKKIQNKITIQANTALENIINAGQNTIEVKFQNAKKLFNEAILNFEKARSDIWFLKYNSTLTSDPLTNSISGLLQAGENIATAGDYFVNALNEFTKIPIYFLSENQDKLNRPSITESLKSGFAEINLAIDELTLAEERISQVDNSILPQSINEKINLAQTQLHEVTEILNSISEHFPAILKLLGDTHPHRYLILLQNDTEIRPSGGFIGSYAIMDISSGYIENFSVHDVYDIDNYYTGFIEPPEEFKAFTNNWRLRDSNYSHHFPLTAEKARWFLETEGGPTVDTIIAINQSFVPDLLKITGPINIPEFGNITSENYYPVLSYAVEAKLFGANNPKEILIQLITNFQKEAFIAKNLPGFARIILEEAKKENIISYSTHSDIQSFFELLGTTGEIKKEGSEDYLSIVHISTGGTKTDPFIDEKITHHTNITSDGLINNELTIVRTHTWKNEYLNQWKTLFQSFGINELNEDSIYILGPGRNRMNTKIYVPTGSKLIIDEYTTPVTTKHDAELGLDYFYLTSEIFPGQSHQTFIKYQLPNTINFSPAGIYRLQIDKQPGNQGSIFTKTLSVAPEFEVIKNYPASVTTNRQKTSIFATNLLYDRNFAAIVTKN